MDTTRQNISVMLLGINATVQLLAYGKLNLKIKLGKKHIFKYTSDNDITSCMNTILIWKYFDELIV